MIVWDGEIQSFAENCQGVPEGLREEGFRDGSHLAVKVVDAAFYRSRAAQAAQDFRDQNCRSPGMFSAGRIIACSEAAEDADASLNF